jgi:hypothetical protein
LGINTTSRESYPVSDIRREKIQVSQLDIGMFVSELDRPWLGTPFMLEGLLIEDQEQIETIAGLCEFVYIDRTVSVGNHFTAMSKESVAIKRDGAINHLTIHKKASDSVAKTKKIITPNSKLSFFDILKDLQSSNQNVQANSKNASSSDAIFNMQYTSDKQHATAMPVDNIPANPSLASQIKNDFSNFISGLSSWGGKQKKLKSSVDKASLKADLAKSQNTIDGYKITIFDEAPPVEDEIANVYPVYEKSQLATR